MKTEIKGIHLEVSERISNYVDKKLPRLDFAKDLIVDFLMNLTREKNLYKIEATVNFRWGTSTHVGVEGFDLYKGIDDLFDKIEAKIEKEKSKVQAHRKKETVRTEGT
jgi:putative sigma-54 modulation protein